jgi:FKBP-type peptidyl-prolyl cis-trans isomerase (trigger factor)
MTSDDPPNQELSKEQKAAIIVVIIVGIIWVVLFLNQQTPVEEIVVEQQPKEPQVQIEVLEEGSGEKASIGDKVSIRYTMRLANEGIISETVEEGENGTITRSVIQSSLGGSTLAETEDNETFTFTLGSKEAIDGLSQGIVGMREGGRRRITVPPELGYGNEKVGNIPANSTLEYEIELIEVKK